MYVFTPSPTRSRTAYDAMCVRRLKSNCRKPVFLSEQKASPPSRVSAFWLKALAQPTLAFSWPLALQEPTGKGVARLAQMYSVTAA